MSLATGLVSLGARGLVRVPLAALRLPATGIHRALALRHGLRRRYDRLADRGVDAVLARAARVPTSRDLTVPIPAPSPKNPVDRAAEAAAHPTESAEVARADLPLDDFDHMTAGSLRGRLRRLDLDELRILRGYEQQHAGRLPILTLLEHRIAKLEAEAAAPS